MTRVLTFKWVTVENTIYVELQISQIDSTAHCHIGLIQLFSKRLSIEICHRKTERNYRYITLTN